MDPGTPHMYPALEPTMTEENPRLTRRFEIEIFQVRGQGASWYSSFPVYYSRPGGW